MWHLCCILWGASCHYVAILKILLALQVPQLAYLLRILGNFSNKAVNITNILPKITKKISTAWLYKLNLATLNSQCGRHAKSLKEALVSLYASYST